MLIDKNTFVTRDFWLFKIIISFNVLFNFLNNIEALQKFDGSFLFCSWSKTTKETIIKNQAMRVYFDVIFVS